MGRSNIDELFNDLVTLKKEMMREDELKTVTVRVTPEIGIMLRLLSDENVLNFHIAKSFREILSNDLYKLLLSKAYNDKIDTVNSLNDFISLVLSKPDFIKNSEIINVIKLLENSSHLEVDSLLDYINNV